MSRRYGLVLAVTFLTGSMMTGQEAAPKQPAPSQTPAAPAPKPTPKLPPPPARTLVAARVNDEPIYEIEVYRALLQHPNETRQEAIDFLVERAIVAQYLTALKVQVDPQEIEKSIKQMKEEAAKEGGWDKVLESMFLTEGELRVQLTNVLRWDEFTKKHATEKAVKDFFDKQHAFFDGSQVRARHILLNGNAAEDKARLMTLRKEIEGEAAQAVAKLPAGTSKLDQEKTRIQALEKAFSERAAKFSECPSKKEGGDLAWFPRSGDMVEPFARAAFALKPYQMSDPVATDFGHHLILCTDYKPGKEVQYENIRQTVKEVYCDRLREAVLNAMRPRTRVVIEPAPK